MCNQSYSFHGLVSRDFGERRRLPLSKINIEAGQRVTLSNRGSRVDHFRQRFIQQGRYTLLRELDGYNLQFNLVEVRFTAGACRKGGYRRYSVGSHRLRLQRLQNQGSNFEEESARTGTARQIIPSLIRIFPL